jgi:UTP--glucose-1-phosphate uridylyltransferase
MPSSYLLIVAAGGYATRALPLTGYGATLKCLINVGEGGATVIEEILREARDSAIEHGVVIVSSEDNAAVLRRFLDPLGEDPDFAAYLVEKSNESAIALIEGRTRLDTVDLVVQDEPIGFGHAISLAAPHLKTGDFAGAVIALGDDVVHAPTPAAAQLVSAHANTDAMIVGVQRVSREDASRYGVVLVDTEPLDLGSDFSGKAAYRVEKMQEKPKDPTPNDLDGQEVYLAVVGRYLIRPSDMEYLTGASGSIQKELDFTALQQHNAKERALVAVELDGTWLSVGTPLDAQKAYLHYALAGGPDRDELCRYAARLI